MRVYIHCFSATQMPLFIQKPHRSYTDDCLLDSFCWVGRRLFSVAFSETARRALSCRAARPSLSCRAARDKRAGM